MFEEFVGLPLHVLIVHASVVLVPLSTLTAICLAVVPRWRWLLRWPVLVSALLSLATVFVTVRSGQELLRARPELAPLVEVHQQRGERLLWLMVGYALVAALAFFALGGPTRLAGGRARTGAARPVQIVVSILLVGLAGWSLVQVVLTGDSGARAVWG